MTSSVTPPDQHPQANTQGPWIERLFFKHRVFWCVLFVIVTLLLGWRATMVKPEASFEKLIPLTHPYIENLMARRDDLKGLANSVRIAVTVKGDGDIFDADYMAHLRKVYDEVMFMPGVDRSAVKSLWAPSVRWTEVTEAGFAGGTVIPDTYSGDAASLKRLRENVLKSGQVGILVANDFRSTIIQAPLLETVDGQPLDYQAMSARLNELRTQFSTDQYDIRIIGFAKLIGDLIDGATQVVFFFLLAIAITFVLLWLYSRCLVSTIIPLVCSIIAVIWQLGLLQLMGYGLDPYSMLVPFLVFAIAVSHGVQVINATAIEAAQGAGKMMAARLAFRGLYIAGMLALVSDAIGFMTLLFIEIQVIQDLAIAAALGVAVVILTNLVLLPILMSWLGVSRTSIERVDRAQHQTSPIWHRLSFLSHARAAPISLLIALGLGIVGLYGSSQLQIGDLDEGAPELRPDSQYNQDNAYITHHYATSADVLVVMVTTPEQQCVAYPAMQMVDRFEWMMRNVEGVQGTLSPVSIAKRVIAGFNEGSLKWQTLSRNQYVLNQAMSNVPPGLVNNRCDLLPVILYLQDHKAETLSRVTHQVENFASAHNSDHARFMLAAGSAGIEAATNEEIRRAQNFMLAFVYAVVSILVLVTFRSWRAVVCIVAPLGLTSVLCQALMAWLGIGVKVATLPVIALGVGIGVDYGIYIYSRLKAYMQAGERLQDAYYHTLRSTGKAVSFTGLTLAIGVGTWAFSPIKFQADMGILLTFMFLWNMIGALWLLPAIAHYLLGRKQPAS
ncbi:RND transporter [Terasakiispira papahanaumokuakeensis]|uniref:RND transporter n=1 Tax=Terasakiispira papahanaumokuakeensis TaxID=197479 RepID=A0A1E2V7M1_9GAMM|nr:MMPL family transporter [Terasakiispira papahanaumokuakeensis]ODC02852.1 RND transporter [Terasakiispira papahanaumokuakeensis]